MTVVVSSTEKNPVVPTARSLGQGLPFFQRRTVREGIWIGALTALVTFGSFLLLFPVYFMIVTSLKTQGASFLLPMKWFPGIQYVP
ncbi:MAG: hypothetical protein NTV35_03590, partial [Chloroflexi bacterium]|nr:hypothetical protein [Chloroflexota bacterium]